MKITTIILILSSFLFGSCSSSNYFEGTIKYRFESNLYNEDNEVDLSYREYSKREFGEYFVESHKKGNYLREYEGKDSIGMDFQVYIQSTNIKYTKYNYNDTLYWESTASLNGAGNFKILEKKIGDTLIDNETFNFLRTEYEMPYQGNILKQDEKYYYNDNLKINPNDFVSYKKSFLYETFKEIESLPYLYIRKSTSKSFSVTQIEKTQVVEKKEMEIDLNSILNKITGKPLKER
ncbi:MAG: hypothetical protein ACI837_002111 [Crocinitomicaceae bacterium]|jgi:hypothetical protein